MNNNTVPTGIPVLDYKLWCEQVGIDPFGEEQEEGKEENNEKVENINVLKKKRKDDKYE